MNKEITTEQLINTTLEYLSTRPMREVEGLVNAWRQVKIIPPPNTKENNDGLDSKG